MSAGRPIVTADALAHLGVDLRVELREDGADLVWADEDFETCGGLDNLGQALTLRLLVHRGELTGLGHPRYGSRVHELIGEPLDRPNLGLLRRYVRKVLREDPRVDTLTSVRVQPHPAVPGAVEIFAEVVAVSGARVDVSLALDLR